MGIFDNTVSLYDAYEATLKFRSWLVGGRPKQASALREMMMRRAGVAWEEMYRLDLVRLAGTLDVAFDEKASLEDLEKVVDAAAQTKGNGFESDEQGLYIGSYQIKAAFRENVNIVFSGERWGKTKKGAKNYLAERLFIEPERIHLGKQTPDGVHIQSGTVSGPQGPRSIVTRAEYVDQPEITFRVKVMRDCKDLTDALPTIWVSMQDNGIGAMRGQGFGTFDLIAWEPVQKVEPRRQKRAA